MFAHKKRSVTSRIISLVYVQDISVMAFVTYLSRKERQKRHAGFKVMQALSFDF
jgi:hypothetical protein